MRKRKKPAAVVFGLLLAGLCMTAAVYAVSGSEMSVANRFQTGSVDLELNGYSKTESGEQAAEKGKRITANQSLSYIPRITALRADCYVRLTVDFAMEKEIADPITLDAVELSRDWVRKGRRLYYTKPLKTGQTVSPFETIRIPKKWNGENASGFAINLTADAIQASHFTPDFASRSPWGTVEVEQAREKDGTDYRAVKRVKDTHTLIYQGDGTFELSSEDLFANFSAALTGEQFRDRLKMTNEARNPIKVLFKCECPEKQKLFEAVRLKLRVGDKTIYEGPLSAKKLEAYQELATLKPQKARELNYELTVPRELKNRFSVEKGEVIWYFQAREMDGAEHAVQTADAFPLVIPALTAAAAASALLALLWRRRQRG